MLSGKQALRRKEKIITWLIAIAVALALLVAFVFVIKNQTNSPAQVGLRNKMLLDVQYWLFYEGYTTPVVTIANLQNIMRRDCKVTVNDKYIFEVKEIPSNEDSQGIIIINTNNFIREDGRILNATDDPIRSACIICKEPIYSSFCGNFVR